MRAGVRVGWREWREWLGVARVGAGVVRAGAATLSAVTVYPSVRSTRNDARIAYGQKGSQMCAHTSCSGTIDWDGVVYPPRGVKFGSPLDSKHVHVPRLHTCAISE